jgi:hypothetical protein
VTDQPDDLFAFGTPDAPSNKLEDAFWKFHNENPHVYELFCKFTSKAINRGYKRFSADMIMHRIRWETAITTTEQFVPPGETQSLKLNDHHVSYYARLWMRDHPGYDQFFRLRNLPNGKVSAQLQVAAA